MIWVIALRSPTRLIANETWSRKRHCQPALLSVNSESRKIAKDYYYQRPTDVKFDRGIRERYITFDDAFIPAVVDASCAYFTLEVFRNTLDDELARKSFQDKVTNNVRKIALRLADLDPNNFDQSLCGTGFCKGLLPSLEEIIIYIPNKSRRKRQRKLREGILREEPFCSIQARFDKWAQGCQHCRQETHQKRSLTLATILGGKLPSELVLVQEYPDVAYDIPVKWRT